MNFPSSWLRMSAYQKMYYLVDTHQARDVRDAGRKLSTLRRKPQPVRQHQPQAVRLPYKDE